MNSTSFGEDFRNIDRMLLLTQTWFMRTRQQWLHDYAATHRNPVNKRIHHICVPAILLAVFGLLWCLHLEDTPFWLNGAILVAPLILVFYARLGLGPFLFMFATLSAVFAIIFAIEATQLPSLWIYSVLFLLAWLAQFIGHYIEGKRPSFFDDLHFLLIGPLWIFYGNN